MAFSIVRKYELYYCSTGKQIIFVSDILPKKRDFGINIIAKVSYAYYNSNHNIQLYITNNKYLKFLKL